VAAGSSKKLRDFIRKHRVSFWMVIPRDHPFEVQNEGIGIPALNGKRAGEMPEKTPRLIGSKNLIRPGSE
jgi:hypothetical protein